MSMHQQATRAENAHRFNQACLRQAARKLHDELRRHVPRPDRIRKYQAEIASIKALGSYVPEIP